MPAEGLRIADTVGSTMTTVVGGGRSSARESPCLDGVFMVIVIGVADCWEKRDDHQGEAGKIHSL